MCPGLSVCVINICTMFHLNTDGAIMDRVQGQIVAGIGFLPVVDVNYRPICRGSILRATVATHKGHLEFWEVVVVVETGYLPHCAIQGDGWCIPFFYDHERQLMVGSHISPTFPVWCEVLPASTHFTREHNTLQPLR